MGLTGQKISKQTIFEDAVLEERNYKILFKQLLLQNLETIWSICGHVL